MRVWHAAGLKPRFNGLGFTKSGFQSPPTRKSGTKLTLMVRFLTNAEYAFGILHWLETAPTRLGLNYLIYFLIFMSVPVTMSTKLTPMGLHVQSNLRTTVL